LRSDEYFRGADNSGITPFNGQNRVTYLVKSYIGTYGPE